MVKRISPIARVSFGLISLTIGLLIVSDLLGLMPSKTEATLQARQTICEALAIQFSSASNRNDSRYMEETLHNVVQRNDEILSAALRLADGSLLVKSNGHEGLWHKTPRDYSTSTHIQVPILDSSGPWGSMEVRFKSMWSEGYIELLKSSPAGIILFILITGFAMYFLFLKKVLKELNPTSVVPDRVKAAFNALAEGVLILDDNKRIILVNRSFMQISGMDEDLLIGKDVESIINSVSGKENRQANTDWIEALDDNSERTRLPIKIVNKKTTNSHSLMVNSIPITDDDGNKRGALATFDDTTELETKHSELLDALSELKKSQKSISKKNKELNHLATRDPLTECLNRRAFFDKFDQLLKYAVINNSSLCCLMLDIDHFKKVNDTYGHAIGDKIIQEFANILKLSTRNDDVVGRYGGEEFCIILPEMDYQKSINAAERIREAVQAFELDDKKGIIKFTVSIGLSMLSDDIDLPSSLVSQADQALYSAKKNGRNRVITWEDSNKSGIFEIPSNTQTLKVTDTSSPFQAVSFMANDTKNLSVIDQVTGLPVPSTFYENIARSIAKAEKSKRIVALLTYDVEMFSFINDEYGREFGNLVLKEIAERLSNVVRDIDANTINSDIESKAICRLGADSFGILAPNLKSADGVDSILKRMLDVLSEKFEINKKEIKVNGVFGISMYPNDGSRAEELIDKARLAKRHAKNKNTNERYQFYSDSIREISAKQAQLEAELYSALHNQEFVLDYQPIVDIHTGKITAVEALVRWNSPQNGIVLPDQFIPLAESTGLIEPLGKWILRTACTQAKKWQAQGMLDFRIAVNISPVQFCSNSILESVEKILDEVDLSAEYLELELTENSIMENISVASATLQKLHNLGTTIALDDFGTGYSSLGYIKYFPIDKLKIDRLFLRNIASDEKDSAIVGSVTTIARSIGIDVVAEGVEDLDQLIALRRLNCDSIQGYLIARPMNAAALTDWMSTEQNFSELFVSNSKPQPISSHQINSGLNEVMASPRGFEPLLSP